MRAPKKCKNTAWDHNIASVGYGEYCSGLCTIQHGAQIESDRLVAEKAAIEALVRRCVAMSTCLNADDRIGAVLERKIRKNGDYEPMKEFLKRIYCGNKCRAETQRIELSNISCPNGHPGPHKSRRAYIWECYDCGVQFGKNHLSNTLFFGIPCEKGHGKGSGENLRQASTGACVQCQKERKLKEQYKLYDAKAQSNKKQRYKELGLCKDGCGRNAKINRTRCAECLLKNAERERSRCNRPF